MVPALLSPEERAQRDRVRAELRQLAPARRLSLRGDAESLELRVVAAADAADPLGLEIAGRISAFLGRPVAVSRPLLHAAGRPAAEAEARTTLETIERSPDLGIGTRAPFVARGDRLPAYRLLAGVRAIPDAAALARALLEPVMGGTPAARRERLVTLRVLLDHPGQAEAAERLGVHRNTISHRVRRIEARTGWDLRDPDLRLALALALRIHEGGRSGAD